MRRTYFIIDVEADGPYPPQFSMVSLGAVKLTRSLDTLFFGSCAPISDTYCQKSLNVCQLPRELTLKYEHPYVTMNAFRMWLEDHTDGIPVFVTDNLAFDWQFMNYYLYTYTGSNPFGYSGVRINDLWSGLNRKMGIKWKHLRRTKHTHNPVDDAKGNAEALMHMIDKYSLNIDIPL